ncbi:MAG: hypothetical protein AAFX86_00475 [Pseudomonadota bacterium]
MSNVIQLDAARQRREAVSPQNPILNALDTLALALTDHDHDWTDEECRLYETAVSYLSGDYKGSDW